MLNVPTSPDYLSSPPVRSANCRAKSQLGRLGSIVHAVPAARDGGWRSCLEYLSVIVNIRIA
jgi:deoxycytidine triphosphate deaminase